MAKITSVIVAPCKELAMMVKIINTITTKKAERGVVSLFMATVCWV